jgi:hypothetical protein
MYVYVYNITFTCICSCISSLRSYCLHKRVYGIYACILCVFILAYVLRMYDYTCTVHCSISESTTSIKIPLNDSQIQENEENVLIFNFC